MKIQVIRDPVKVLVFRNLLTKKENNAILAEAISLKKKFVPAIIDRGLESSFRSNLVCYYDSVFSGVRKDSVLLTQLDLLYSSNNQFREVVSSFGSPFSQFLNTNNHETQVSNYGRSGEKYNYHIDNLSGYQRIITFVYYFFAEPKKFSGGDIEFTNSPIYNGIPVEENPATLTISPENNMAVVFDSTVPHFVHTTNSPSFNSGRFSVNSWIGFK